MDNSERVRKFKPGDKVRVIDSPGESHKKGEIRTVESYLDEFVYFEEGGLARGGWREERFELVEPTQAPAPSGPKFRNAVEESIWVSFVCSAMQSIDPLLGPNGREVSCEEAADIMLEKYRARLQDGKPSAK